MVPRSLDAPPSPLDAPHDGWTQLPTRDGLRRSFVSGEPDGTRLRVCYFMRDADSAIVGRAWFGPHAEGPPGHAHGGSMAALLDEAMGAAAWLVGHRVLAAKITVEFRKPLPLGSVVTLTSWVERAEGRRVYTRGELRLPGPGGVSEGGIVCAAGEGLFVAVDVDKLRTLVGDDTDGPLG